MRWLALICLVTTTTLSVSAQETPQPAVNIERNLQVDLAALGSPEFKIREAAMQRFMEGKIEVVEPLKELARHGNTESSVRAIELLRRIYLEGDDELCTAIESALESLIMSDESAVAARAQSSIYGIAQKWHQRAIDAFVKLGGIIRYSDPNTNEEVPDAGQKERPIRHAIINRSWKGGDEGLRLLRRIEDFRILADVPGATLFVIKGTVSREAILALEAELPNLHIQQRGPACLGVTPVNQFFRQLPTGLQIEFVKTGTGADLAGIRRGDILLKFDGHDINDFDTLVDKIGEKLPGDKVPVIIERDQVQKTVTVELRGWD